MVTLKKVDSSNWRDALTLTVHPEQLRFVANYTPIAAIGLAKAYVSTENMKWLPYVMTIGNKMVGFVTIAYSEDDPKDVWICHFFIDQRYQGRGYGKEALLTLIEAIQDEIPAFQRICLTVHPENKVARVLYENVGFQQTGEMRWDEPVFTLREWLDK